MANYVKFDWAIKRLLRNKANAAVLEGFVSVLLNEKCTILEFLESEGNQESSSDKYNRVDIKAKNSQDEIIIIEVQVSKYQHYIERMLYGVSKAITEMISLGDDYDKIRKVYSINILYFDFGQGKDYIYHGKSELIGIHDKDRLMLSKKEEDDLEEKKKTQFPADSILPEYYIIRINNFNEYAKSSLEEWISFLKSSTINNDTKTPGLVEAKRIMDYDSMTPEQKRAYRQHIDAYYNEKNAMESSFDDGYDKGKAEGFDEGKAEGIDQTKIEIARNMKNLGIDASVIAKS
ncbi:MAG: Rpn family recombination-promoting nuclease/putative transposase, partial [Bacteroidales bacterium]|nr:Rpn family recombination-promoting nuclease/putative transposase [Bacteroidales bacterium]